MLKRYSLFFFFFILLCNAACFVIAHDHNVAVPAEYVLNEVPPLYQAVSIIEKNEWRELKIDSLLHKLNYTKTSFGQWGLKTLTRPITDIPEIQARQEILLQLIENDRLSSKVRVLLQELCEHEKSLLTYWNEHDALDNQAQNLYFSLPFVKDYANNNRLLLEGATFFEWSRSLLNFAKALCLGGLWQELMYVMYGGADDFNIWRGLKRGFEEPLKNNNPFPELTNKPFGTDFKTFIRILVEGNLGDRCRIFARGYDRVIKIVLPRFKSFEITVQSLPASSVKLGMTAFGASLALGYSIWYDIYLYNQIKGMYTQLVFLHNTANALQRRLMDVAAFINKTKQLYCVVKNDPVLKESRFASTMRSVLDSEDISKTLNQLLILLQTSTFKKPADFFYFRGRVLFVHKKLHEVTQELVPLLQALAELDAYYSIATVFKKYQSTSTPFSFVEFVDREMPLLDFTSCWLPLLPNDQVVANEVCFGTDSAHQTKLIITGPNGCGKSTYLKMLGQTVVLAQSWGIVPATNGACMTPLHGVRSCLASYEDINHGLSTFMAEDKRMCDIQNFVDEYSTHEKCLVLIDEPWRGTVDAASAQYIYQFGRHIAPINNCIACIATHVQKPIELADETNGAFANAHVAIDESEGGFARTFELQTGPALWWFNDVGRRTRFIDWLKTIYGARSAV